MARKRTHHDAPRTKSVTVRLREATFDRVKAASTEAGLTRAGYVEHLLENRPLPVASAVNSALPVALINELKRIGNNLNQIAHNTHCEIPPSERAIARVVAEILQALAEHELMRRRLADVTGLPPDAGADQLVKDLWDRIAHILPHQPVMPAPAPMAPHAPKPMAPARAESKEPVATGPSTVETPPAAKPMGTARELPAAPHPMTFGPLPTFRPYNPLPTPEQELPAGFELRKVDGKWQAVDPSSAFARAVQSFWHAFRPPAEPDFTTTFGTAANDKLLITRKPKPQPPGGDDGP